MTLSYPFEIIIGIAAPLGTDRKTFLDTLEMKLKERKYVVKKISITEELINFTEKNTAISFKYFVKMEVCNELRKKYSNGFLMGLVINKIRELRNDGEDKVVYIIDQIKNLDEYNILSHVYGLNFLQISLFSNEQSRFNNLRTIFKQDSVQNLQNYKYVLNEIKFFNEEANREILELVKNKNKDITTNFQKYILPDVTHNLIKKDFTEMESEQESNGQQVSKLFHLSHYFFNLDNTQIQINKEIKKFLSLVEGNNKEYPTQDEFGMSLAFQVSVRSNFPNNRHIGAAIISPYGEVISVASIRAPCSSSNTTLHDQSQIQDGYKIYKDKIEKWKNFLKSEDLTNNLKPEELNTLKDISTFFKESLDFHPCTHAEIAAIIDAAKLGISVRDASLYTTTFPCHLCAKEIINAGFSKVIYLEAYPKSKNKELYPKLIDFDPTYSSSLLPFSFYSGVGPKRFMYVYSTKNKKKVTEYPPLLAYERSAYYNQKEEDIISYLRDKPTHLEFLTTLFNRRDD